MKKTHQGTSWMVKLLKIKDKEKILKEARGIRTHHTSDFMSEKKCRSEAMEQNLCAEKKSQPRKSMCSKNIQK